MILYDNTELYNVSTIAYDGVDLPTTPVYEKKTYIYKVYGKSSYKWDYFNWDVGKWSVDSAKSIINVWRNEVISDPSYRSTINSGDAELRVTLARPFDNFGEGSDIAINNTVELWVFDRESPNGKLQFSGYITGYAPTLDNDNEYLTVWIRGIASTLSNRILRDSSGNTTITYTNTDPSNIFRDIIDKFRTNDSGEIGYTTLGITLTNTTVSYSFNTVTYKEALDKVLELCPVGWYYRVDECGYIYLSPKSTVIDHQISTKKDVVYLVPEKNIEDFANEVYFTGGDTGGGSNLFLKKSDAESIDDYGRVVKRVTDSRVITQSVAEVMMDRVLSSKSTPTRRTTVRIIDSNGTNYTSNIGYDIESIKVGNNIQISEITGAVPSPTLWDSFLWDSGNWDNLKQSDIQDIMQVTSVTYNPDYVEIEATTRLPEISKRIEEISKSLDSSNFSANPTTPTEII